MAWNRFSRNRESKLGNSRVSHKGFSFASKLESALYDLLLLREAAGEIKDLKIQHHVKLTEAEIKYIVDFSATMTEDGSICFFEAKGFETPEWLLKRKLWTVYGPGKLEVWKGSYQKLKLTEVILPSKLFT